VKIFVFASLHENLPEPHRQYVNEVVESVLSYSEVDLDSFFKGIQGLSVGPLRFRLNGSCGSPELSDILKEIFSESGYISLHK